jgi:hypothetical protein
MTALYPQAPASKCTLVIAYLQLRFPQDAEMYIPKS